MRKLIYLILILMIMFLTNDIFAQEKRILYRTSAGSIAVVKEDSLHMIPDSVLLNNMPVPVDSLVRFFDLEDSLSKYWDSLEVAGAIGDSLAILRLTGIGNADSLGGVPSDSFLTIVQIQDTVITYLTDSLLAYWDSVLVAQSITDSINATVPLIITDSLAYYSSTVQVTQQIADSLSAYWDSVLVATAITDSINTTVPLIIADSLSAYWDSVLVAQAISDSINATVPLIITDSLAYYLNTVQTTQQLTDTMAVLRNNMQDSAIVIVADSLPVYWDSVQVASAISDSSVAAAVIILADQVDSMNVLRAEMPDSAIAVMNDSMPILRDNMQDSALIVINDTMPILRNNMIDSAIVVMNDSMPILRNNMIDSAMVVVHDTVLIWIPQLRDDMMDTAIVALNDSLPGYWDSVQVAIAISDSVAAAVGVTPAVVSDSIRFNRSFVSRDSVMMIDTVNTGYFANHYNSDFVFGSPLLNDDGMTNHYSKFMFDKGLSAFRAGSSNGSTWWNRDSLGLYSFASGQGTKAKGTWSFAHGGLAEATQNYAVAFGQSAKAWATNAMSFGTKFIVEGNYSMGFSIANAVRTLTQANAFVIMGGNVGIDTLLPNATLHVNGTGLFDGDSVVFNNTFLTRFQNEVRISSIAGSNKLIIVAAALPEIQLIDKSVGETTTRIAQLDGDNYWNTSESDGKFILSAGANLINDSVFVVYGDGKIWARFIEVDSITVDTLLSDYVNVAETLILNGVNITDTLTNILDDSLLLYVLKTAFGDSLNNIHTITGAWNITGDWIFDGQYVFNDTTYFNSELMLDSINLIDSVVNILDDTMVVLRQNMMDTAIVALTDSLTNYSNTTGVQAFVSDSISYAKIDSFNLLGEALPYDIINAQEFVAFDEDAYKTVTDTIQVVASIDTAGFGGKNKYFSVLSANAPEDTFAVKQQIIVYSPIEKIPYGFIGIDSVTYRYKTKWLSTGADTNAVNIILYKYNSDGTIIDKGSDLLLSSNDVWVRNSITPSGGGFERYDKFIIQILFFSLGEEFYAKVADIRIYWKVGS